MGINKKQIRCVEYPKTPLLVFQNTLQKYRYFLTCSNFQSHYSRLFYISESWGKQINDLVGFEPQRSISFWLRSFCCLLRQRSSGIYSPHDQKLFWISPPLSPLSGVSESVWKIWLISVRRWKPAWNSASFRIGLSVKAKLNSSNQHRALGMDDMGWSNGLSQF